MCLITVLLLAALLTRVYLDGKSYFNWSFINHYPSMTNPENSGVKHALYGTIWLMVITAIVSVPLGVGAAVYLNEYARNNRFTRFVAVNIANLAGVPSIVYGLLGLAVFVRWLGLGRSVLSGALTLSLLVLPIIIMASREALRAVPRSLRLASYALGTTRWQTVRHHVLPAALPGISTGVILALSRAIGEAAPIMMIGAVTYIAAVPGDQVNPGSGILAWINSALMDEFSALPLQIFNWAALPQEVFHHLAATAIIVLLIGLLAMNSIAVGIRLWFQRGKTW